MTYPTKIAATYLFISRKQYRAFAISHFVAPFSILGSLAIIYRILRFDRCDPEAHNKRTYQRLVVVMSICDLLGSLALLFGTLPIPKETLLETARGNTATCTAQGFFFHWFAVAVLYYNTGLMIYFLMKVRYRWTEARVAKWLEPAIHAWALVVPLGQSVAGLFLHIFNPIGYGNFCYISPYPVLCGIWNACTRGKSARILYIYFVIVPVSVLLATIYVSIALIYCAVREQAGRALAITANRDSIRARTKAVAVQSILFAVVFFCTWVHSVLGPLVGYTAARTDVKIEAIYILSMMTSTFLPLQGFFNFCIYIRPRFMFLWKEQGMTFCAALRLSVFGRVSTSAHRRSTLHRRKSKRPNFGDASGPNSDTCSLSGGLESSKMTENSSMAETVKVGADVQPSEVEVPETKTSTSEVADRQIEVGRHITSNAVCDAEIDNRESILQDEELHHEIGQDVAQDSEARNDTTRRVSRNVEGQPVSSISSRRVTFNDTSNTSDIPSDI